MCGVKMQRNRQRRRTGIWSVDSMLVHPKSRCCIFNRFHLISDLISYLVLSSFNLYHQWLAGHYQASSIRRERGQGACPPPYFLSQQIFFLNLHIKSKLSRNCSPPSLFETKWKIEEKNFFLMVCVEPKNCRPFEWNGGANNCHVAYKRKITLRSNK